MEKSKNGHFHFPRNAENEEHLWYIIHVLQNQNRKYKKVFAEQTGNYNNKYRVVQTFESQSWISTKNIISL